jgi:hypothetical protein
MGCGVYKSGLKNRDFVHIGEGFMNESMGQNLIVEKKPSGEQLRGAAVPKNEG